MKEALQFNLHEFPIITFIRLRNSHFLGSSLWQIESSRLDQLSSFGLGCLVIQ